MRPAIRIELPPPRADGVYRWFYLRAFPLRDAEGRIALCIACKPISRSRSGLKLCSLAKKRLLELVASGRPMPDILVALCRLVEGTASGCYCSMCWSIQPARKLRKR